MITAYNTTNNYFTDSGNGKTVVFLHGFLETSSIWKSITPAFATTHRVICIDLLGHGKTASISNVHTMEMHANSVAAVLEHLNITQATFIGHSMGGYVALAFAELYPNKINGLCLLNSSSKPDSEARKLVRSRSVDFIRKNHQIYAGMALTNLFTANSRKLFLDAIKSLKKEAHAMTENAMIASVLGMKIRKNRTEILLSFNHKKMLIIGEKDTILSCDALVKECEATHTTYTIFPGGHMSFVENKNMLISTLKVFLGVDF